MTGLYFPEMQYVNVRVSGIEWDTTDDNDEPISCLGLPLDIDSFEVELDEDVDVHERWREDGCLTGFDILCEDLVEQLSDEYGFTINAIDDIEVLID